MLYNYKKTFVWLLVFAGYLELTGCASITSEVICGEADPAKNGKAAIGSEVNICHSRRSISDGIVYYMPKRDIRIDVKVARVKAQGNDTSKPDQTEENNKQIIVSLVDNRAGETLPDLRNVFLLRYSKNWIGQNNMAVGVSPLGLLTITHADTINKINDIAAYLAIDAAALSMGAGALIKPTETARANALPTTNIEPGIFNLSNYTATFDKITTECKPGTYSLLIDPLNLDKDNPKKICGLYVYIEREFINLKHPGNSSWLEPSSYGWRTIADYLLIYKRRARNLMAMGPLDQYALESVPGVFYKQDRPYKVSIYEKDRNAEAIFKAFSPNESGIYLAPISETLFTDNTNNITLINGVVNSLKQNTDSELLGLAKIPANALGGFTNALGEIFGGLEKVSSNESQNLTNELSVLWNTQMITRCQMAIAANNPAGKTGDELTIAFNAIQTACNSK